MFTSPRSGLDDQIEKPDNKKTTRKTASKQKAPTVESSYPSIEAFALNVGSKTVLGTGGAPNEDSDQEENADGSRAHARVPGDLRHEAADDQSNGENQPGKQQRISFVGDSSFDMNSIGFGSFHSFGGFGGSFSGSGGLNGSSNHLGPESQAPALHFNQPGAGSLAAGHTSGHSNSFSINTLGSANMPLLFKNRDQQDVKGISPMSLSYGPFSSTINTADLDLKNKVMCGFCGKLFSHQGTLGRHLDTKKGNRLHPTEQVDAIRANVKRRGDEEEVRLRRQKKKKEYNAREDIKERLRNKRKVKVQLEKAEQAARNYFLENCGRPVFQQDNANLARFIVFYLNATEWPKEPAIPETHLASAVKVQLEAKVSTSALLNAQLELLDECAKEWSMLSTEEKNSLWSSERARLCRELLGGLTAYDFGNQNEWIDLEKNTQEKTTEH